MTDHPCTCPASRDPYKLQHSPECPWQPMTGQPPADALYDRMATGWNAMKSEDVDSPRTAERLAEVAASETAKRIVCRVCQDTHRMEIGGLETHEVPCTHCPTPCPKCCSKPQGPYCATTPCPCECHAKRTNGKTPAPFPAVQPATPAGIAQAAQGAISERERAEFEQLRECMRAAGLAAFMRDGKPADVAEHLRTVTQSYTNEIARLHAECEAKASAIERLAAERDEARAELVTQGRNFVSAVEYNARLIRKNQVVERKYAELANAIMSTRMEYETALALTAALDRQARETSATASAESARETPGRSDATCRPPTPGVEESGSPGCGNGETPPTALASRSAPPMDTTGPLTGKGEPAAEAQGGALTAEDVAEAFAKMEIRAIDSGVTWSMPMTKEEGVALVERYAAQHAEREVETNKAIWAAVEREQLAAASAECERLRDKFERELTAIRAQHRYELAQRPDARLRGAALALAREVVDVSKSTRWSELWPLAEAVLDAHVALAADPAPQVERYAREQVAIALSHDGADATRANVQRMIDAAINEGSAQLAAAKAECERLTQLNTEHYAARLKAEADVKQAHEQNDRLVDERTQLRAQLTQLREAASAIVKREANREWNDERGAYIKIARSEWAALRSALAADPAPQLNAAQWSAVGTLRREVVAYAGRPDATRIGAEYGLTAGDLRALLSLIDAADPAPQVEREALPTLAECLEQVIALRDQHYDCAATDNERLRAAWRWIESRDNALTAPAGEKER